MDRGKWTVVQYNLVNFFQEKEPLYLLRRALGGLQSLSGRCRLETNHHLCVGSNHDSLAVQSLVYFI